jgi:hypothetical protein
MTGHAGHGDTPLLRLPYAASTVLTLTPRALLGLFFIQRYRFLTIAQFARASGLSRHRAEDLLHSLELKLNTANPEVPVFKQESGKFSGAWHHAAVARGSAAVAGTPPRAAA